MIGHGHGQLAGLTFHACYVATYTSNCKGAYGAQKLKIINADIIYGNMFGATYIGHIYMHGCTYKAVKDTRLGVYHAR